MIKEPRYTVVQLNHVDDRRRNHLESFLDLRESIVVQSIQMTCLATRADFRRQWIYAREKTGQGPELCRGKHSEASGSARLCFHVEE